MKATPYFLIFLLLLFSKISAENWFSEYWQQFFWRTYVHEQFEIRTFFRVESGNHMKKVRAFLFSEQLHYIVNKDVNLELHYTYIHGHPLTNPFWRWQHRLEFEFNRIFRLPYDGQLITRNRLEVRWREKTRPYPDTRFRHRAMLVFPVKNLKPLKYIGIYNEIFYDISRNFFDQDRICPCQLTFGLTKKVDLDVFLMIRMLYENDILRKSVVLGTQLNF